MKVPNPQFEGQTKTKLGNSEVKGIVESCVNEKLGEFLEENPRRRQADHRQGRWTRPGPRSGAQGPRPHAEQGRAGRRAACPASSRTARSATPRSPSCSSSRATPPAAPPSRAATAQFQAILPLRGKILNVEKARLDKTLATEEIRNIITALGTGIGADDFDVTKLRYHRIIIMSDADVDGSHIRTLLLTFFYRQMHELIERGHLYIAQPPLYKAKPARASATSRTSTPWTRSSWSGRWRSARCALAGGQEIDGDAPRPTCSSARRVRQARRPRGAQGHAGASLVELLLKGAGQGRRGLHGQGPPRWSSIRPLREAGADVVLEKDEEHGVFEIVLQHDASGQTREVRLGDDFVGSPNTRPSTRPTRTFRELDQPAPRRGGRRRDDRLDEPRASSSTLHGRRQRACTSSATRASAR